MPVDLDNSSTASGEASVSSSGNQPPPPQSAAAVGKKKRNLPGMPDPDAEVIALSPKTLLATNRFVCEICNKGFQRDQNLQLHRRGHNLPWKLRQRSGKEVKKRVYVCPELTCVHHDPSRALGDLTGIKKHFCRKHGEKKWKCDKCSKKYAVQSDWKAHSKICGTREYKCDCGTLFSRRDSFITHRAFCDALAEESNKSQNPAGNSNRKPESEAKSKSKANSNIDPPPPPPTPPTPSPPSPAAAAAAAPALSQSTGVISSSVSPIQSPELADHPSPIVEDAPAVAAAVAVAAPVAVPTPVPTPVPAVLSGSCSSSTSTSSSSNASGSSTVFASLFASSTGAGSLQPTSQTHPFTDLIRAMAQPDHRADLAPLSSNEQISLCLSTNHGSSIFGTAAQERRQYAPPCQPAMSATALLQKAAQMGPAATNASLLRGFGILSSSSSSQQDNMQWGHRQVEPENSSVTAALGLGLHCDGGSGLKELMMQTPSVFGPKQTTLDFLGLGMAAGGSPNNGLSALITSISGGLDVAAAAASFGGSEFTSKDIGRSS
ncbi:zinc finger protein GAI-ASSOCIATED FACTOR 1-like [Euphorbia lathyris]|uniref:zinc finger protein GAI-ASSOCIATED FACTOR 1-like n=1 Tax=Euphorbia lathyris TaxID=212925 RepID=UPI0033142E90